MDEYNKHGNRNGQDAILISHNQPVGFIADARKRFVLDLKAGKTDDDESRYVPAAINAWENGDCITCSACGFACPTCQNAIFHSVE